MVYSLSSNVSGYFVLICCIILVLYVNPIYFCVCNGVTKKSFEFNNYKWAKRTKFPLAQSYVVGSLDDIQTALKPIKQGEKM